MSSKKIHSWQSALMHAVTDPQELLELLELDLSYLEQAKAAAKLFPLKVPREFISRMQKGDLADPLLRQVLPLGCELIPAVNFSTDPLGEKKANKIPGILHKYHGRVLLTLSSICGINCRFCFRRHFPYAENNPGNAGWQKALDYIALNPSISEVILSGGDPLTLHDHLLRQFCQKFAAIPHIKRLRIHSRMPIVIPERINSDFIEWISETRLKIILVTHSNHPQEINNLVIEALRQLKNVTLLNQAVLLKGVNDEVDILIRLSEALLEANIQPYYLHLLDKVQGTAHFEVDLERAKKLYQGLINHLPGYLVPKLVYEQPGHPAKTLVDTFTFYTD